MVISVSLGAQSYPVLLEPGALARAGAHLSLDRRVLVVTDSGVPQEYAQAIASRCRQPRICTLPAGEGSKSMDSYHLLLREMLRLHMDRGDCVAAVGGGMVGDLAGFAAATYMRGVDFYNIPTTLLAQVDSSVGGKVAIDLPQGKNLVGAFYQPEAVLCDPDALNTLTDEFWRDGLGEVVKYGCIGDAPLFALLEHCAPGGRKALMGRIDEILTHCIQAKADVVAQDERDTGLRMTLNFGHTIGHAVEACQHYQGLSHGEAVALGMAVITRLSEARGMTQAGTAARLDALLEALALPRSLPALPEDALIAAMGMDKKSAGDALRVIVLDRIGVCRIHNTTAAFFRGMA